MSGTAGAAVADGQFAPRIAAVSEPGGRSYNEDRWGQLEQDGYLVCVVADGAGGHGGGDIASGLAVGHVIDQASAAPLARADEVEDLLRDTNHYIVHRQQDGGAAADMHSTVVAAFADLRQGLLLWGHAGDSRLYLFRDGRLVEHTRDHSVVQQMVDAGALRPDEVDGHPLRSQLLSALGVPDQELTVSCRPQAWRIEHGDTLLLCSDGVWEYLADAALEASLAAAAGPEDRVRALEQQVRENAARKGKHNHDNFTALAVRFERAERQED